MLITMTQPKGNTAWNKGLTKEQSPSLARQAKWKSDWWAKLKLESPEEYARLCEATGGKSRGKPGLKMEKSGRWKGGRRVCKRDGYVFLHRPDHPDARKDGDILEHRLVMEQVLGRRLYKDEDVNHVNGKKDDNRPENLKLVRHYAHYEEMSCPRCEFKFYTR